MIALYESGGADFCDDPDDREAWESVPCRTTDPDVFFPEKGESVRAAVRVCDGCGLRQACLDYALDHGIREGVWGGTSAMQRRAMLAEREHGGGG